MIERFLDGETTNSEERELYDFFASGDVPAELEPYREMFAWFDGGYGMGETPKVTAPRRRHRFAKVAATVMAAAAAVIIGLMLQQPQTYVESYIIRDGMKITDPEIVARETAASWEWCENEIRLQEEMDSNIDALMREMSTFKTLS